MIKALFEGGIISDFFVGTSVGGINAAFICGTMTMDGIFALERIWLSVREKEMFPSGLLTSVIGILMKKNYLVSQRSLRKFFKKDLLYTTLGETKITCLLITTDILTEEQIVLSSGNAVTAVLASSELPGIFPAMEMAGRILIDGAIPSNTPISVAAEYGAAEVFILPVGYSAALQKPPSGVVDIFLHSLKIHIAQQFLHNIEIFRNNFDIHILPPLILKNTFLSDLSMTGEYLSASYRNTKQWLESGGLITLEDTRQNEPTQPMVVNNLSRL
ncbi:MAG: patatin-like phospholipase family protein [Syntrophales bacterium LBB04]|nr:patatin-like phospholipase family protein [Syntrophales bacterium LBB04]